LQHSFEQELPCFDPKIFVGAFVLISALAFVLAHVKCSAVVQALNVVVVGQPEQIFAEFLLAV
jgi:hypothetical protein